MVLNQDMDTMKFKNVEVIKCWRRDPDAEGVEGMSASKMRAAAE